MQRIGERDRTRRNAKYARQLLDDDRQREPEREAAQHRLRDEIGHAAQARATGEHEQHAGRANERRRISELRRDARARLRTDGGSEHGGRRRSGRNDRETAAPEQRIDSEPREQRNDARLRRHIGDTRVSHGFGQQEPGDGHPGEHILERTLRRRPWRGALRVLGGVLQMRGSCMTRIDRHGNRARRRFAGPVADPPAQGLPLFALFDATGVDDFLRTSL